MAEHITPWSFDHTLECIWPTTRPITVVLREIKGDYFSIDFT